MTFKILIIDDDPYILRLFETILQNDFEVITVSDSHSSIDVFKQTSPDLILLDIMMPKVDGLEILSKIREIDQYIPIIMLSAKSQTEDKVTALSKGADDYITKPFKRQELLARIKSALRRTTFINKPCTPQIIKSHDLIIDILNGTVYKNQTPVLLSKIEFALLKTMAMNPNKTLTRHFLYNTVWEYDYANNSRTLDNFIRNIRKKIEDNPNEPKFIRTVHGIGYCFNEVEGELEGK